MFSDNPTAETANSERPVLPHGHHVAARRVLGLLGAQLVDNYEQRSLLGNH